MANPPGRRPALLFPLFAEAGSLRGIGPRLQARLAHLCGGRVIDLLWHLPAAMIDRRAKPLIAAAPPGAIATMCVTVGQHLPPERPSRPHRIQVHDETGEMMLAFFHARADWLQRQLPTGQRRVISGRVEWHQGTRQMLHPDCIGPPEMLEAIAVVEPVYPLTAGLHGKVVTIAIRQALQRLPALPEWQDPALVRREAWPPWDAALTHLHHPQAEADLSPSHPSRRRLVYDELLADQLAVGLYRRHHQVRPGVVLKALNDLRYRALAALPWQLTAAQNTALAELDADLASGNRMRRLLQGDVGSGKTIVAALCLLRAIEHGLQGALMAPTEILARQHAQKLGPLFDQLGIGWALLLGRGRGGGDRRQILAQLRTGTPMIAIGTHALLQEDVAIPALGLAVIDEQHRFGVQQRANLTEQNPQAHLLVMTATPIPRTLALAAYGDLDVTSITAKPSGRQPITTRLLALERLPEVIERLRSKLAEGAQAYWVCPLIDGSEDSDLAAASARYRQLQQDCPALRIGLVHGQMKAAQREAAMADFAAGQTQLLVATTVIEVGVDVPNASIMVIEHAERFGLAQLHQLRGRVGRGQETSACLLLFQEPLGATARARLELLRDCNDGFRIAEEDLRLRGPGEMLGRRQSGQAEYRLADLSAHGDLLGIAYDEARLILHQDPDLTGPRGAALRLLLYLMEKDRAAALLRAG